MAKMLTAKSVDNAKAPATRREIPDGSTGLYLIVQPSGTRSWAYRYRYRGQPRKLTLGTFPLVPLVDKRDEQGRVIVKGARTLAAQAREAKETGRDPAGDKAASAEDGPDRDLFPVALAQFIERYAKPKNRRWQDTARLLGLRVDPETQELLTVAKGIAAKWGSRRVQEITKRDILDLLDGIVDRGAGFTANRTLAALRRFFGWLIERDVIKTASPCAGVKAPATETQRDRVLTDDEIRWFWQASAAEAYPFGSIAQLLLLTGQRKSEVADAVDSELDLDKALWTIPGERTKNGDTHTVHLARSVLAIIKGLSRIKSERGYLFTTTGLSPVSGFSKGKIDLDSAMLAAARKEAGEDVKIEPWRFHDLRRTVASGMAKIGIDLPVIEKVLNHKSGSFGGIVGVYQRHGYDAEKQRALDAWARHVDSIISGKSQKVVRLRG